MVFVSGLVVSSFGLGCRLSVDVQYDSGDLYAGEDDDVSPPYDSEQFRVEKYGRHNRWRRVDGKDVPPPMQQKFLEEWCLTWPRPCPQTEWARRNGVNVRSVQNWLTDPRFRAVWRESADDAYASPMWTQPLVAETYRLALNEPDAQGRRQFSAGEQLKAIDQFAKFVQMTAPLQVEHRVVPLDVELAAMSTAELVAAVDGDNMLDDVLDVDSEEVYS